MIATNPEVERKGAANVYTSLNGHMFSFLDQKGELSLRFAKEDREMFPAEFNTKLSEQYGTVMKEYVIVPDALFSNTSAVKKYFNMSFQYVGSLKPKKS